jgi:RNAse (barnase) inhibitor barstar
MGDIEQTRKIIVDASTCLKPDDFYKVLLSALDAPGWHGHNLDALWDSITRDINGIGPPYFIEVVGTSGLPNGVVRLLAGVHALFAEARDQENIQVAFNFR